MDPRLTSVLFNNILAVCPIFGVSVGVWTDKTTWIVDYDPAATTQQRTAATTAIANFDPVAQSNTLTTTAANLVAHKASYSTDPAFQDMVSRLDNATAAQISTYVQTNVTDLASAKVLLTKILLVL